MEKKNQMQPVNLVNNCLAKRDSGDTPQFQTVKILVVVLLCCLFGLTGCQKERSKAAVRMKGKNSARPNVSGVGMRVGRPTGGVLEAVAPGVQGTRTTRRRSSWPQFRGWLGRSVATRSELPIKWDAEENITWRTELPGRGASSPVVVNDRVFVTAYTGYGISAEKPGKIEDLRLHLICIHRDTGEYIWKKDIQGSPLTQRSNAELYRHGFASSTPVVDNDYVYAFFGPTGVVCFDHSGELVWRADVGFGFNYFGSSASLIAYGDLLIVNASIESNSIFAINRHTGKGVWKIDDIDRSFAMPVLGRPFDGRTTEMVVMEEGYVRGYNPETGEELWYCEGVNNYVVATPFIADGVCYCNGGIQKQMMAIKLGGRGDVTETHKLWEVPQGANVTSPIYLAGQLYMLADNSILQCFDASTGELVSRVRTPSKARAYSSPLFSGEALYVPLEDNGVFVCQATSEFKELSHNIIESDKNSLKASLAATAARIFLRTDGFLYCIGGDPDSTINVGVPEIEEPENLITFRTRYDYNKPSWKQPYNFYLDPVRSSVDRIIIKPYENLLDESQVVSAKKFIDSKIDSFNDLRSQQKEAYWKFLQSGSENEEELDSTLEKLDEKTLEVANVIRKQIKSEVMTKEQLKQHIEEVAERRTNAASK